MRMNSGESERFKYAFHWIIRSARRNQEGSTNNENRKRQRKEYKQLCDETDYEIRDGKRYVIPYVYKHETHCKQVRFRMRIHA